MQATMNHVSEVAHGCSIRLVSGEFWGWVDTYGSSPCSLGGFWVILVMWQQTRRAPLSGWTILAKLKTIYSIISISYTFNLCKINARNNLHKSRLVSLMVLWDSRLNSKTSVILSVVTQPGALTCQMVSVTPLKNLRRQNVFKFVL